MRSVSKSTLWTAAKYGLAIGVLIYVVYVNWAPSDGRGLGDVWQHHVIQGEPIHWVFLLLAFTLHAIGLMTTLVRWFLLVRAQDLPFTLVAAIRFGTLGFLFNAFLPGSVGGDVVKAAALARGQSRQTVAVATVVMDRLLSLWGLILLVASVGSVCWFLETLDRPALAPARVVIGATVVIVGLSAVMWIGMGMFSPERTARMSDTLDRVPKIGGSLAQLWQSVWLYRYRPASIVWAIVLSTISNVCDVLAFFCYVLTFWDGVESNPLPTLAEHFLLVPVGLVISAVPLFPGGAGIGEAGFGGLYSLFDSAAANGVLGSLLFRVSGWLIGILGYLACLVLEVKSVQPELEGK